MKITNFKNRKIHKAETLKECFSAQVDVTTGILGWKHTTTKDIHRKWNGSWFFIDNGKYVPGAKINQLERSFLATKIGIKNKENEK